MLSSVEVKQDSRLSRACPEELKFGPVSLRFWTLSSVEGEQERGLSEGEQDSKPLEQCEDRLVLSH